MAGILGQANQQPVICSGASSASARKLNSNGQEIFIAAVPYN
jgi:hypothetical protein